VDRSDADGIVIFAPESTNPPTPGGLKNHLPQGSESDSRFSTIIIMRATLRHRAPNTYYGQWPREKAAVCCIESLSIAHNEVVTSTKIAAVDARERVFPGNRGSARGKFTSARKTNFARKF
jgi:phosphoglucomutase